MVIIFQLDTLDKRSWMVKTGSKGVNFLNLVENQYVKFSHVLQETGYTMLSIKIMIFFQYVCFLHRLG